MNIDNRLNITTSILQDDFTVEEIKLLKLKMKPLTVLDFIDYLNRQLNTKFISVYYDKKTNECYLPLDLDLAQKRCR